MKKIISILLIIMTALVILSLAACNGDPKDTEPKETEHTHKYDILVDRVEPTCQAEGAETMACECGEQVCNELPKKDHEYTSRSVDPTCTEKGYTEYTCSVCSESYKDNYVDAKGHSYTDTVTAPTCTEKGFTTHNCSVCGDKYDDSYVDAKGHSYTDTVTAPTCTEKGFTAHNCSVCGDKYEDNYVDAKGHSYTDTVTAPTCTEKGFTTHNCSVCGNVYKDSYVDAKGHSYVDVVTPPTSVAQGYTTHTCSVCGDSYKDSYVAALPTGFMIYYEDFDDLKSTMSSTDILKNLGWKALYRNYRDEIPKDVDLNVIKTGAANANTITLSAKDGELILTNPSGGFESFIQILSTEYMSEAAKGDYSVQVDMTFKSGLGWASLAPRYQSSTGYNSCYAAWKIKPTGYGNHEAKGPDNFIRPTSGVNTIRYNSTTVATGWWCSRVKGYQDITKYNKTGALLDRKVTIIIQVVNADSDYNYKPSAAEFGDTSKMTDKKTIQGYQDTVLGYGFHIWVLDENGQRVLVSAYNPASTYHASKDKWESWLGDALAFGVGSNVTVAIDNLAVYTGLGLMPEDKSTAKYEALLEEKIDPIKADTSESGIVIAKNKEAKLYMVIPEDADRNVLYARDKFKFYVEEKMGVTLPSGTQSGNAYELLIGDTGRAESKALKATLMGNQYAIKRDGNKIIVVATNDAFLYDAIEYLIENYFEKGEGCTVTGSKMVFTGSIDRKDVGDTKSLRYLFTKSKTISSVSSVLATMTAPDGDHTANQGGCTDGKYYYQAFIDRDNASSEANNTSRIVKTDLATGKCVMISEKFMAGHTNDLTYNPKTNQILVANNKPNYTTITILDATTLKFIENVTIPNPIYSVTYSPERDIYFVGCSSSNNVRGITADFKLLDQNIHIADPSTWGFTTQGIGSDDTFVYTVLYKSSGNVIAVFDWYGNYVGTIKITLKSGSSTLESESIDVDDQGRILVVASKRIWHITPTA